MKRKRPTTLERFVFGGPVLYGGLVCLCFLAKGLNAND